MNACKFELVFEDENIRVTFCVCLHWSCFTQRLHREYSRGFNVECLWCVKLESILYSYYFFFYHNNISILYVMQYIAYILSGYGLYFKKYLHLRKWVHISNQSQVIIFSLCFFPTSKTHIPLGTVIVNCVMRKLHNATSSVTCFYASVIVSSNEKEAHLTQM